MSVNSNTYNTYPNDYHCFPDWYNKGKDPAYINGYNPPADGKCHCWDHLKTSSPRMTEDPAPAQKEQPKIDFDVDKFCEAVKANDMLMAYNWLNKLNALGVNEVGTAKAICYRMVAIKHADSKKFDKAKECLKGMVVIKHADNEEKHADKEKKDDYYKIIRTSTEIYIRSRENLANNNNLFEHNKSDKLQNLEEYTLDALNRVSTEILSNPHAGVKEESNYRVLLKSKRFKSLVVEYNKLLANSFVAGDLKDSNNHAPSIESLKSLEKSGILRREVKYSIKEAESLYTVSRLLHVSKKNFITFFKHN